MKKIADQYGYSVETAIHVTSIPAAYEYLKRLRYNGQPIAYERMGSFENDAGVYVDWYCIYTREDMPSKKTKIATLYINSYCLDMPDIAPKGFTLEGIE